MSYDKTAREMYRVAIDGFVKLNRADLSARAQSYLAREAIIAKLADAESLLNAAKKAVGAVTEADMRRGGYAILGQGRRGRRGRSDASRSLGAV